MSTGRGRWWRLSLVLGAGAGGSLLSFEGPRAEDLGSTASAELENCTIAKKGYLRRPCLRARRRTAPTAPSGAEGAHRQDVKGTRWMPWHQEPKKDVDGCDKPR
jgi:hypothetical protein